jgi:hypothetical protein
MRRGDDVIRGSGKGGGEPPEKRGVKRAHPDVDEQAVARREWEKDSWGDRIDWLADILGTMELLELIIGARAYNLDDPDNRELKRQFRDLRTFDRAPPRVLNGIFFMKGHWYSCRNNVVTDSYQEKFQITGTAHFCQTFAAMIFLGKTDELSVSGGYAENVRLALRFLHTVLKENSELANRLIREIRTSEWKKRWIPTSMAAESYTRLGDINIRVLLNFLTLLENNVNHLYQTKTT